MKYYINGKEIVETVIANEAGVADNRLKTLRLSPDKMATDDIKLGGKTNPTSTEILDSTYTSKFGN